LQSRYAGFRAINGVVLSIDQIQSLQKDDLVVSAKNALNIDGGDVIIFAGAPLSGFKKIVQKEINAPIIDCAEAALKQAELAVVMNKGTSIKKKLPPKISVGLDNNLANYIAHKP
jgi:allantoin racemase